MGGGIKSLVIALPRNNKPVYYPGDLVEGVCDVAIEKEARGVIPGVVIRCRGQVKTYFTVHRGKSSQTYSETHELLSKEIAYTFRNYGEFRPGSFHRLPFQFQLPESDLFTTFECDRGYIRYWIEADSIQRTWLISKKVKSPIKTLQLIDTNNWQYRFPIHGRDKKSPRCWCCRSGPLFIETSTDRAAYCPNEIVTMTAKFRNDSRKVVKPYVKLAEKVFYTAQGESGRHSVEHKLKPADNKLDDPKTSKNIVLSDDGCTTWSAMRFQLPEIPPSLSCGILKVSHSLIIGIDIGGWAGELKVDLPIVIGTIPFQSELNSIPRPLNAIRACDGDRWIGTTMGRGKSSKHGLEPVLPPLLPPPETYDVNDDAHPPSYFARILLAQQPVIADDDEDCAVFPGESLTKSRLQDRSPSTSSTEQLPTDSPMTHAREVARRKRRESRSRSSSSMKARSGAQAVTSKTGYI